MKRRMKMGKTCRQLTRRTGEVARDAASNTARFARRNPWTTAGIATAVALGTGLLALQRRMIRRREIAATSGENT